MPSGDTKAIAVHASVTAVTRVLCNRLVHQRLLISASKHLEPSICAQAVYGPLAPLRAPGCWIGPLFRGLRWTGRPIIDFGADCSNRNEWQHR
jgi:hypothetical protein